ncbi:Hypothetical predicted protein [Cloeon dipterum]|uniref:Peptidase S1 domain-containing protein n=1 Tax=Cloeon dipterum TaxID=197152 RepID=A0A8S1E0N3_9INSE|nr:Hypothetical predicted protein [Cloeon dipterum]
MISVTPCIIVCFLVALASGAPSPWIIGGEPATEGEFPSIVSVQVDVFISTFRHNCGGTIISERHILTAAHCLTAWTANTVRIVAGSTRAGVSEGDIYKVAALTIHEEYDQINAWINDIAIITLETPIVLKPGIVEIVTLPPEGQSPEDGAVAVVAGWGDTQARSDDLLRVEINIVNQRECQDIYYGIGYPVYPGQICAGVPQGNMGSCQGDSGGPLYVDGTQHGLVSWALGCADPGYPTVFTRINYYISWIQQHVQ